MVGAQTFVELSSKVHYAGFGFLEGGARRSSLASAKIAATNIYMNTNSEVTFNSHTRNHPRASNSYP